MTDTKDQALALQRQIALLEQQLRAARNQLNSVYTACRHEWGDARYDPIVREAYNDPGDPPGMYGIDRRLPMYVPRQETPRWTRTCRTCGLIEHTERSNEHVTKTPRFG